jgi:hypothetical protein
MLQRFRNAIPFLLAVWLIASPAWAMNCEKLGRRGESECTNSSVILDRGPSTF